MSATSFGPRASVSGRASPARRRFRPRTALIGLGLGLAFAGSSLAEDRMESSRTPVRLSDANASAAAMTLTAWVLDTADNQGLPFVIVDKADARVLVFDREGRLLDTAPALLGLARGDISPPGIGDRPLSAISAADRITPAGRFVASMGENLGGKGILWIDYDDALSLHPVVTTRPADRRLERLATVTVEDNRISYGCVNVPEAFYVEVVQAAFEGTTGIVYILPEVKSLAEVFFQETGVVPSDPAGPPPD